MDDVLLQYLDDDEQEQLRNIRHYKGEDGWSIEDEISNKLLGVDDFDAKEI